MKGASSLAGITSFGNHVIFGGILGCPRKLVKKGSVSRFKPQ